ncbi:MAG: Gldg family protein, partial [Bacteroidota bacterium]
MNKRNQSILQLLLFIGIMVFVNILANFFYTYVDLTEEKRFTFTGPTQELLDNLEDVVYVQLLLDGEFPAGFKRLQKATIEMLEDFRSESGYLEYVIEDPSAGTTEEKNEKRTILAQQGINPTRFRFKSSDETKEKQIYPWAIFNYKGRSINVNLLENQIPGLHPEEALNNSVSLLEYKFANAIQKLESNKRMNIVFTSGHGELEEVQTASLERDLRKSYNTGRLNLDSVPQINPMIDLMIVAKPRGPFSEKDKFKIDQYVMNGGKVIWLIDRLNAQLDSLNGRPYYVPTDYPINLEDQLFRYGVKIEPNLVLDLECTRIPKVVGQMGNSPQLDLDSWFYHPMVFPGDHHPIIKSLDRVNLFFPSSIDTTVRTRSYIEKTVLLESSKYSRLQYSPVRLNLEIMRYEPDPAKFNK